MFTIALACLLTWGALAFGAEYTWGYSPLLVSSGFVAALGFRVGHRGTSARPLLIMVAVAPLCAAVVQLVPLPHDTAQALNPASFAVDYRALYDSVVQTGTPSNVPRTASAWTPLSIAPSRTVLGVAFVTTFLLLFTACARAFTRIAPARIARVILILGVTVAFAQLIQRASGVEAVYGFWRPPSHVTNPSAPFINRNHTAGWLLMAVSLSLGYGATLVRRLVSVTGGWRQRILQLASPEANELLMVGLAILVMAVGIVATASRSGFLGLVGIALVFTLFVAGHRQAGVGRRAVAIVVLVGLVFAAFLYGGAGLIEARLSGTNWHTLDGRLHVWQDTLRIIEDSPFVGMGLNTYGIAMLRYQRMLPDGLRYVEAHNDYLQLAAEGGLLLGIPIVIAAAMFVREAVVRLRDRADAADTYWLRAGAVTGLIAMAGQELGDFTLQMPGAAALFAVLAAIAVHRSDLTAYRQPSRG